MDRLEELVREKLSGFDPGPVDSESLITSLNASLRRRNARARVAGGLVAIAAVSLGVFGVAAWLHSARRVNVSTTRQSPGGGTQTVSWHDLEVDVPAGWKINDATCGTPVRDTVIIPEGPIAACGFSQPPGLTVVRISTALHSVDAVRWAQSATDDYTLNGHQARRGIGTSSDGTTELSVVIVPDADIAMSVESPSASLRRSIVDSARIVSTDSRGCSTRLGTAPSTGGRAGTDDSLVPDDPSTVAICRYTDGLLERSVTVADQQLGDLRQMLSSLPPPHGPSGPPSCTADADRVFVLRFRYRDGPGVDLRVHIGVCTDLLATNGIRSSSISSAVLTFLVDECGYDGAVPGLDALR